MSGFGNDLENKTIKTKLYHSCTAQGLVDLIQNYTNEHSVCFSTEASSILFGRPMVIELTQDDYDGEYTPFDADSGKNHGYDEFRVSFDKVEDLQSRIETIVMSRETYLDLCGDRDEERNSDEQFRYDFFLDFFSSKIELIEDLENKAFYNITK
jgi:hypothetical protein